MSDFGKLPAHPVASAYDPQREGWIPGYYAVSQGLAEPGLNIQQHAWLSLVSSAIGDGQRPWGQAVSMADAMLPAVLKRLEELA